MSLLLKTTVILLLAGSVAACGKSDVNTGDAESRAAESAAALSAEGEPPGAVVSKPAQASSPTQAGADAAAYFGDLGREHVRADDGLLVDTPEPQSVVLIVIDALNARNLGAYGYHRNTTPHIDALAKEGLLFSNHVSNSSWTRPSYTSIITGLPKSEHGVELGVGLTPEITTIAERFRDSGYRTAGFVGNPLVREIWGFGKGFQLYKDTKTYKKGFPFDGLLVDDALKWLDTVGESKHFTLLFLTAPHSPYRPPRNRRKFLDSVPKGHVLEYPFREYKSPLPKGVQQRIIAAYDDEIAYSDYQVGRIVKHLTRSGKLDETAIVVVSDHGEMLGEHNCYGHAYHMWEQTLRVPLVIRSRNLTAANKVNPTPHTHIDLAPSLFQLAGIPAAGAGLPGRSFFERHDSEPDRIRLSQYNAHGIRRQAIREERYKLIHYHQIQPSAFQKLNSLHGQIPHADPEDLPSLVASLEGERFELYDMIADPKETTDKFEEMKTNSAVLALMDRMVSHLGEKGKTVGAMSEELIEALKNAGYFVSDE